MCMWVSKCFLNTHACTHVRTHTRDQEREKEEEKEEEEEEEDNVDNLNSTISFRQQFLSPVVFN